MLRFALAAAALAAFAIPAAAQVVIEEVRMQLFLERSGRLSDSIAGSARSFRNTVIGEGDAGEPADSVLVTLVLSGPKNAKSSDKIARDLVQVTVTQSARTGQRILLKRAYGGFLFGESGRYHKAFLLDAATCAPLEIEAKSGRSKKIAKVEFSCGE